MGHWAKAASLAGAPSFFPSRSFGVVMAFARDYRTRWLVVDHKYRFERGASLLVTELDECVDIAEAHVIGARRDAIDRFEGTVSRLDRHFEFFRGEIAPV
jgi:hypothetical protein